MRRPIPGQELGLDFDDKIGLRTRITKRQSIVEFSRSISTLTGKNKFENGRYQ